MYELFVKNRYYSIEEIVENGLSNMNTIYGNFVEFKRDNFLYLFEKKGERLRNAFTYRFIAHDKLSLH
jgi:hypothetical protein